MIGKKKTISFKGKGKWETFSSLDKYRKLRDKKNKIQKESRKRNRNK